MSSVKQLDAWKSSSSSKFSPGAFLSVNLTACSTWSTASLCNPSNSRWGQTMATSCGICVEPPSSSIKQGAILLAQLAGKKEIRNLQVRQDQEVHRHLRSDCDLFWSCWCWPSQFWYLSQLLPCYHLLKPTFLLSIFLHVNRLILFWFVRGPIVNFITRKEWSITELEFTCNVSSKVIRLFGL